MGIQYKMVKQNDNLNPEGFKKIGYYPRVVRRGTVNLKKLSKITATGTPFSAIQLEAVFLMLVDNIEQELLNSNHVYIDGFGTFSLTAASRIVDNPDEIRAESISVKRVVFKPSAQLMTRIRNARFERLKK